HGALLRRFVGAPAQQRGAMPKAFAGEVIVANFHHELRLYRHPFARALGRPATRAAGRIAGKTSVHAELLEFGRERRLFLALDGRGETDMMQQALLVVEAEQQRADDILSFIVPEATDHAVGAAVVLDFLHAGAVARAIFDIAPFRDDTVE